MLAMRVCVCVCVCVCSAVCESVTLCESWRAARHQRYQWHWWHCTTPRHQVGSSYVPHTPTLSVSLCLFVCLRLSVYAHVTCQQVVDLLCDDSHTYIHAHIVQTEVAWCEHNLRKFVEWSSMIKSNVIVSTTHTSLSNKALISHW